MQAIEYTRRMLPPPQMRLPAALESVLQEAITVWEGGQSNVARSRLKQATRLAQKLGYL